MTGENRMYSSEDKGGYSLQHLHGLRQRKGLHAFVIAVLTLLILASIGLISWRFYITKYGLYGMELRAARYDASGFENSSPPLFEAEK